MRYGVGHVPAGLLAVSADNTLLSWNTAFCAWGELNCLNEWTIDTLSRGP